MPGTSARPACLTYSNPFRLTSAGRSAAIIHAMRLLGRTAAAASMTAGTVLIHAQGLLSAVIITNQLIAAAIHATFQGAAVGME